MANPQPEPFLKFSKELFDALLLSNMPATHKEIVLAVIRRTYGDYGKKVAPISHSLIRRMTGRADSGIRRCMEALEAEGVIVKVVEPTFRTPAEWKLNKDYEHWGKWSVPTATTVAEGQELAECQQSGRGDRQSLAEGSATTVAPLKTYRSTDVSSGSLGEEDLTLEEQEAARTLHDHPLCPFDLSACFRLGSELVTEFPDVDACAEIGAWYGFQADNKEPLKHPAAALKGWFRKAGKQQRPTDGWGAYPDIVIPEDIRQHMEEQEGERQREWSERERA